MKVYFSGDIPRPVTQVFNAITDHVKLSKYFISSADSSLVEGKEILWEWDDQGASHKIQVLKIESEKLIRFSWQATGDETFTEIKLDSIDKDSTRVTITEGEWQPGEEGGLKALQQTSGWTDFFCSLKAYLLFNVNLRSGERY